MTADTLVLGIGNLLLGDEGVGVRVVEALQAGPPLPEGVACLDGGTGSLVLLEPMQAARRLILVDATLDGRPPGTVTRLTPRYAADYSASLSAHDIGLRDLLDIFHIGQGGVPEVVLFAVSVAAIDDLSVALSPAVAAAVPEVVAAIRAELGR